MYKNKLAASRTEIKLNKYIIRLISIIRLWDQNFGVILTIVLQSSFMFGLHLNTPAYVIIYITHALC